MFLNTTEVEEMLGIDRERDEGIEIVRKWSRYLRELDHSCVVIKMGTPRIFSYE